MWLEGRLKGLSHRYLYTECVQFLPTLCTYLRLLENAVIKILKVLLPLICYHSLVLLLSKIITSLTPIKKKTYLAPVITNKKIYGTLRNISVRSRVLMLFGIDLYQTECQVTLNELGREGEESLP